MFTSWDIPLSPLLSKLNYFLKLIDKKFCRVGWVMDTRITSQKMKFQTWQIQKMVLHCFEFRVLVLRICKQFKLMQYVALAPWSFAVSPCAYFTIINTSLFFSSFVSIRSDPLWIPLIVTFYIVALLFLLGVGVLPTQMTRSLLKDFSMW